MSPKTPRNISGQNLIKLLQTFGYEISRQKGSHIRLTHSTDQGSHHITIPDHNPLKLGTLSAIVNEVAEHLQISKDSLLSKL